MASFASEKAQARGHLAVLNIRQRPLQGGVRELRRETFTFAGVYAFEDRLGRMRPENRNMRPTIRQQLQVLRDHRVLEFMDRGTYRVPRMPLQS